MQHDICAPGVVNHMAGSWQLLHEFSHQKYLLQYWGWRFRWRLGLPCTAKQRAKTKEPPAAATQRRAGVP